MDRCLKVCISSSYVDMIKSLQRESLAGDKDCLNSMTGHDQKIELQSNAQHGAGLRLEKSSAALASCWSKVSPKASRFSVTPEPFGRHSSTIHSSGAGSDTGSVSTESMVSLQSSNTHHSVRTLVVYNMLKSLSHNIPLTTALFFPNIELILRFIKNYQ